MGEEKKKKEKEEKAAAAEGADLLCSLLEQGRLASPAWTPAAQPSDHPMIKRDRWNPTGAPAGMRALVVSTPRLHILTYSLRPKKNQPYRVGSFWIDGGST